MRGLEIDGIYLHERDDVFGDYMESKIDIDVNYKFCSPMILYAPRKLKIVDILSWNSGVFYEKGDREKYDTAIDPVYLLSDDLARSVMRTILFNNLGDVISIMAILARYPYVKIEKKFSKIRENMDEWEIITQDVEYLHYTKTELNKIRKKIQLALEKIQFKGWL